VKGRIPPWNFIPNEITRNWYPVPSQANEFTPLFGRYKNMKLPLQHRSNHIIRFFKNPV
jgi:hypothetical protein